MGGRGVFTPKSDRQALSRCSPTKVSTSAVISVVGAEMLVAPRRRPVCRDGTACGANKPEANLPLTVEGGGQHNQPPAAGSGGTRGEDG